MLKILFFLESEENFSFFKKNINKLLTKGLIPDSLNFSVEIFLYKDSHATLDTIFEGLLDAEYIVIFKEESISLDVIENTFFISNIDLTGKFITPNEIREQIQSTFKKFLPIIRSFMDRNLIELLRLPVRNFHSGDFLDLCELFKNLGNNPNFVDDFEKALKNFIANHKVPKRRSNNKKRYYLDERKRFFELGLERHARHETGGNHNIYCNLSANFRFGCKIEAENHFNVSYDDSGVNRITGIFSNCHNESKNFVKRTHLNIFSNDYIT